MKIYERRTFAFMITTMLVILSIFWGCFKALNKMEQNANDIFMQGVDRNNYSIESYLQKRIDLSFNMITIANRYINNDNTVVNVISSRQALLEAKTPPDKMLANQKLTEATTILYEKLGTSNLSDVDAKYRQTLFTDLTSRNQVIDNAKQDYNVKIREYNNTLTKFPCFIINIFKIKHPLNEI